jgi:hypothetical protein
MREKKTIILILALCVIFCRALGQETANSTNYALSDKAQTVSRLIALDSAQMTLLTQIDLLYQTHLDTALNYLDDPFAVCAKLDYANQIFELNLFENVLTANQTFAYITYLNYYDVMRRTYAYLQFLANTQKYSAEDLTAFREEIFNYLNIETQARVRDHYWFERAEDSVRLLEKTKPASLVEAEALWTAKQRGIEYQNGFKW